MIPQDPQPIVQLSKQGLAFLSFVFTNILMPFFALLMVEDITRRFFFGLFMLIMFSPEIVLAFSKPFRLWIKKGIEDNDEKFNTSDFTTMMTHYAMLWCVRVFVTSFLVEIFFDVKVREIYILSSFAGAFGVEVVGHLFNKIQTKPKP